MQVPITSCYRIIPLSCGYIGLLVTVIPIAIQLVYSRYFLSFIITVITRYSSFYYTDGHLVGSSINQSCIAAILIFCA